MTEFKKLYTEAGERLRDDRTVVPWGVYPRPHLERAEWMNLNGWWELETESGAKCSVRVPFPLESPLSGFEGSLRYGETLTYKRSVTLPEGWKGMSVRLNLGAVSREHAVFINGKQAGEGFLAYFPLSMDITKLLVDGENEIEIECKNDLDPAYPYGKQKLKRGGMWYTPCTGIWQTVWLEPVPKKHILDISCTVRGCTAEIRVFGFDTEFGVGNVREASVICEGKEYPLRNGLCLIGIEEPRLWSPGEPNLYEFTVKYGGDEAKSYFAFRTVEIKEINGAPRLCLNGKPFFFNGLLDQGYYSDGLWTPAEPEEYERDILKMKSLGFNMLRKHIKIEPELFYYYCDKLGMAVFQDMVNNGRYSFLRDTVLPTAGVQRLPDGLINRDKRARGTFLEHMRKTVSLLSRHPSIVYWTVFNEGWGQFEADKAYLFMKELDGSRPTDTASGWFSRRRSDVSSRHIYFKKLRMPKKYKAPQVLSEFGGYVWKDENHSFNPEKTYGYRIFKTRKEFVGGIRKLYLEELLPLVRRGLSAAVYTQVSDVEDETNGLLTFDRRVMKLSPEEFADVSSKLFAAARGEEE